MNSRSGTGTAVGGNPSDVAGGRSLAPVPVPGLRASEPLAIAATLIALASGAAAQQPETLRKEIWDIAIGQHVATISDVGYMEIACGTNGGPRSSLIAGFGDFARCRPEPGGLHEVYFEYDDELLYIARAHDFLGDPRALGGATEVFGYDAFVSVLVDAGGVVKGLRIVTDPRTDEERRQTASALGRYAMGRFGLDGWQCVDHPQREGFGPADGYVDQTCEKIDPAAGTRMLVAVKRFRKPGQTRVDRFTGRLTVGSYAFESSARFEMFALDVPVLPAAPKT